MFTLMKDPAGAPLLVNLGLCLYFKEEPGGAVNAITVKGVAQPLGMTFDTIAGDLVEEGFIILQSPEGRLLLNLFQCFCIVQGPDKMATAFSTDGVGAPTGKTFAEVQDAFSPAG